MSDLPGWEIANSKDPADPLIADAVIDEMNAMLEERAAEIRNAK